MRPGALGVAKPDMEAMLTSLTRVQWWHIGLCRLVLGGSHVSNRPCSLAEGRNRFGRGCG